jgi:signal transduction histidine kinase
MELSWLNSKLKDNGEGFRKKTASMIELVNETIRTVKRITTDLRPGLLDDLGLVSAIEWQAEDFEKRTGIKCRVRTKDEDISLEEDYKTALFRIFQEALTNTARHAGAACVDASLRIKEDKIIMRVADNGRGITKKEIMNPRSFGLIGIKERVRLMKGEVTIKGARNRGTEIKVMIPYKKNHKTKDNQ